MFWGLSEALDLQKEYLEHSPCDLETLNIIIIGGSDARHILKTIARSYRHKKINLRIHVFEGCMELVIRQFLFLTLAFHDPKVLGIYEKTTMFMELYGNTLLRPVTSRFLSLFSGDLIKMITDLKHLKDVIPILNFERLKYRDIDSIEVILKFWEAGNGDKFDICKIWDWRVRRALGARYDARFGVFDWDYSMRFKDIGGAIVSAQEFKHFRSTGVSFTWLEREVSRPNVTLAAGISSRGQDLQHCGYIGDITTGPYVAYGLNCDNHEMMKKQNGIHLKRATDITERNIMEIFHEIESCKPFDEKVFLENCDRNLGVVTLIMPDAKLSRDEDNTSRRINKRDLNFVHIDNVEIHFHSYSALEIYPDKLEFQDKFHIGFIASNLLPCLRPSLINMMENDGLLLVEGRKFVLDKRNKEIEEFGQQIRDLAASCGCDVKEPFQPLKDSFAKLAVRKK